MRQFSLRFRLAILAICTTVIALTATAFVLNDKFTAFFHNRVYSELEQHIEQLASNLSLNDAGEISVAPMLDRRFMQPFSGLYWQVSVTGAEPLISRSLWGQELKITTEVLAGERAKLETKSPTGVPVLASAWAIVLGENETARKVVLVVAVDQAEVLVAVSDFRRFLFAWLTILLVALAFASWVQIRIGLAPLKVIHGKIEAVKNGQKGRLDGQFPPEVQPLINEVNTLLEAHDTSLIAARAKAGDLAHGLKTPLTVMRAMLHDIRTEIDPETSAEMAKQIDSMHRFIERELAVARQGGRQRQNIQVLPVLAEMVTAMEKLPKGSALTWQVDMPAELAIPFDRHDLAELLGNILDNARKWARTKVVVRGEILGDNGGIITIADDGSGVAAHVLEQSISRGASGAPDGQSGSGLGLAITADLIKKIGGDLTLKSAKSGGLEVTLNW